MGRIFPDWSSRKLGIGPNLLYEAIGYVAGMKKEQVVDKINRTGDVGQAVEELLSLKSQTTFFHEELDIVRVYNELISIAEQEGKRLSGRNCSRSPAPWQCPPARGEVPGPDHARRLRISIGEGSVREAIAKAFGVDSSLVEHAMQALNDLGEVARLAKTGAAALQDVQDNRVPSGQDDARPAGNHRRYDQGARPDRR